MEFFKIRRTIPFMRYALVFNIISLLTFLAAVFFLAYRGLNFSIEFTGGTLIEVGYAQAAEVDKIREALARGGYKAEVQNFGSSREVLIRMHLEKNQSTHDLSQKVLEVLRSEDKTAELRRVEFVGPQVGRELAEYGALALLVTAVGIVLYLWMRFEWRFGLSAIIANLHDVVIILGCFALFQWEFSLPVLAAVLAVLGYSVNESVIVFDRVREYFRKMRKASTAEVIDAAITSTISRTIITHGSTQDGHHHAAVRRRGAALLRARPHHRHPVRHLLLGAGGEPAADLPEGLARRPDQARAAQAGSGGLTAPWSG